MKSVLVDYFKHKETIQKRAQKEHDFGLKEFQDLTGDYGYVNFIDPRTNKRWKKIYFFAQFEKIDSNVVPFVIDNREKYGMR